MSERSLELPNDFNGIVRLFPLPNLVLFPGVIQALNIFESRYRIMMADAIENDGLIAMAMVKPQQVATTSARPDLFETICIGKVMTHAKLEDGCFNLLLAGVHRARILEEVQFELPYRKARVELIRDFSEAPDVEEQLRSEIVEQFIEILPGNSHLDRDSLEGLLESKVSTGQLVDLIAFSCGATPLQLQELLTVTEVCQRAKMTLKFMKELAAASQVSQAESRPNFPPDFSAN